MLCGVCVYVLICLTYLFLGLKCILSICNFPGRDPISRINLRDKCPGYNYWLLDYRGHRAGRYMGTQDTEIRKYFRFHINIFTPIIVQLDSIYLSPSTQTTFKTSKILIEFSITTIMKKCHQMSNGTKTYNRFANIQWFMLLAENIHY